MTESEQHENTSNGPVFWIMFVIGLGVIGFGVWTLLQNASDTNPPYTAILALAFNVTHDALVAPLVCVVGVVVAKVVPARVRGPVAWGLVASAMVLVVGFVPLTGYGEKPDNLSLLPLNYPIAVATVLGVVWAIVALLLAVSLPNRRSGTDIANDEPA